MPKLAILAFLLHLLWGREKQGRGQKKPPWLSTFLFKKLNTSLTY